MQGQQPARSSARWIVVTGGAGFIGSHVVADLLAEGHSVVVLDNFENSGPSVIDSIEQLGAGRPATVRGDVRDPHVLDALFRGYPAAAVVHLAGKKAVAESVADPILYFDANLNGAISLLRAMRGAGVTRLVFSSSATVYGLPRRIPVRENAPVRPTNPYGRTKAIIEQFIDDLATAWPEFRAISLRYFNPVGAHPSGMIGERPTGTPNNLFPLIADVATGRRPIVKVFGNDYPTPDGTGLRDYVHVVDLARGHVAAVARLLGGGTATSHLRLNLGTGKGHSVMEALVAFSRACGFAVPFDMAARRPGDVAALVADATRAADVLGWRAVRGLDDMCVDHWAFASRDQGLPSGRSDAA